MDTTSRGLFVRVRPPHTSERRGHLAAGRLWWRWREESTGTSKPNMEVKKVCQIAGAQASSVVGRRVPSHDTAPTHMGFQ